MSSTAASLSVNPCDYEKDFPMVGTEELPAQKESATRAVSDTALLTEMCQQGIRPHLDADGELAFRGPPSHFTPEFQNRVQGNEGMLIWALRKDPASIISSLVLSKHTLRVIESGVCIEPPPSEPLKEALLSCKWPLVRLLGSNDLPFDANPNRCRYCWGRADSRVARGLCQACEPGHVQNVQEAERLTRNRLRLQFGLCEFPVDWEQEYRAERDIIKLRIEQCDDDIVRFILDRLIAPEPTSQSEWEELGDWWSEVEHILRRDRLLPRWDWTVTASGVTGDGQARS
jgi:hypothetical protein